MSSAALENLDIEYWDIANQFRLIDASSNPPNFDRVSSVNYGDGKIKNFKYDSWGKVLEISAIDKEKKEVSKESFKYDEFDRIAGKTIVKSVNDVEKEKLVYDYSYTPSGKRSSVAITFPDGSKKVTKNVYDKYSRLAETVDGSRRVSYKYDDKTARLKEQNINGIAVFYSYTKLGQLESKIMGDTKSPISTLKYFYTKDGQITAREVNGKRQNYEYDVKGQLLAVKDSSGNAVEKYAYDPAGNILSKTVDGKTVTYIYDESNQLISAKTADGKETSYRYDAAGRLTEESGVSATKEYSYGWLDKVMKVRDIDGMKGQDKTTSFSYHVDGQLAERSVGSESERFFWDGLALVRRNDTSYLNEPSVTGGNPILADDKVMFNDMLGNTLGIYGKDLQEVKRTSFGSGDEAGFFTGKPYVKELGAVFLFRNYRSDLGKWQTADPLGYPDGWNNFAYCNNSVTDSIDWLGGITFSAGTYTKRSTALPDYVGIDSPGEDEFDAYAFAELSINTLLVGLPTAKAMALHYLDNTGSDYTVATSSIQSIFSSQESAFQSDATSYLKGLSLSSGQTVNFVSGWIDKTAPTLELYLSLHDFYYCVSGTAEKQSNGSIDVILTVNIYDYYDFSTANALAGIGLQDVDWLRLAQVGLAKPYNVYGTYRLSFTIPE